VATAALVVLVVPAFDARMEILHVGHAGDTVAWMAMFLAAAAVTMGVWRSGRLPVVAGFFAAHLGLQALRLLAGQTSVEAVEIPAASLGLFLLATVVLADPQRTPGSAVPVPAVLVGALAGGVDVALRALGMPYAPLLAVAIALAVAAPFGSTAAGGAVDQEAGEVPAGSAPARGAAGRSGAGRTDPAWPCGRRTYWSDRAGGPPIIFSIAGPPVRAKRTTSTAARARKTRSRTVV
jgi:hypothetical protein